MDRVNRHSKMPLYHQIYEIVRASILDGHWRPGDLLPAESELVARYEVSRTVVRQALDALVNEGLIYRQRGRGTFVAHPTVEQSLARIISFTDDMRQRGCAPGTEVFFSGLVPASEEIAAKLEIEPGEQLARLDRLRLADGEPMGIEQAYLVHRYCPGVLDGDYASNPLREVLAQRYNIHWTRASQIIRATPATPNMARLLSVKSRSALLHIERVSYWQRGIPVEFLHIYYRGDRYSLYCDLQG